MVAIVDYDTGNLRSVVNALQRCGAEWVVSSDHKVIEGDQRVLLPGVGEGSSAMETRTTMRFDSLAPLVTQTALLTLCRMVSFVARS